MSLYEHLNVGQTVTCRCTWAHQKGGIALLTAGPREKRDERGVFRELVAGCFTLMDWHDQHAWGIALSESSAGECIDFEVIAEKDARTIRFMQHVHNEELRMGGKG